MEGAVRSAERCGAEKLSRKRMSAAASVEDVDREASVGRGTVDVDGVTTVYVRP